MIILLNYSHILSRLPKEMETKFLSLAELLSKGIHGFPPASQPTELLGEIIHGQTIDGLVSLDDAVVLDDEGIDPESSALFQVLECRGGHGPPADYGKIAHLYASKKAAMLRWPS